MLVIPAKAGIQRLCLFLLLETLPWKEQGQGTGFRLSPE
jgi:hypothetical protein